jgi:hypothetical protein
VNSLGTRRVSSALRYGAEAQTMPRFISMDSQVVR